MKTIVQKSPLHGIGVFSVEQINSGEIIEVCNIIKLMSTDLLNIDETNVYNYYFDWENNQGAIALGNGSIYNHSYTPNAIYKASYETEQFIFKAIKDITLGEEILVNYNGAPDCKDKLWFHK